VPTTDGPDRADVLYTSDLHGSERLYRDAIGLAHRLEVRALLLGGDLAPHGEVATQRRFFREFFLPLIRDFLSSRPSARVDFIFGNDDWAAGLPDLLEAGVERFHHAHGRVAPFVEGSWIAGLASVPATPFPMKDWDRWEDGLSAASRLDGMRSAPDGSLRPYSLAARADADSMEADLEGIRRALPADGSRVICMFHGPPHGTALDQIASGVHVGSRETRRFFERIGPALGLHGHIHESPFLSGRFADRVGDSVCVNAGQRREGPLHAVWFGLGDPRGTLTHSVLGKAGI
jgi:hypothetical protein